MLSRLIEKKGNFPKQDKHIHPLLWAQLWPLSSFVPFLYSHCLPVGPLVSCHKSFYLCNFPLWLLWNILKDPWDHPALVGKCCSRNTSSIDCTCVSFLNAQGRQHHCIRFLSMPPQNEWCIKWCGLRCKHPGC